SEEDCFFVRGVKKQIHEPVRSAHLCVADKTQPGPFDPPEKAWSVWILRETRKSTMRLSKVAALALIVGAPSQMSVSLARAAADCSISGTLADWGENSTGYIDLTSGESCLFPIKMRGTVSGSDISKKPVHGKLKKLNVSTFKYTAKARYKGSDSFAIKATGQG